ncbi:MAG: hypothetical protein ACTSW1_19345 [Candidatus Hodarchaeales archaeon]
MKKLITSIWNWIKSIFKTTEPTEPTVEKTHTEKLFDKLKEDKFFDVNEDKAEIMAERDKDLTESARKTNDFNDSKAKGINDEGILNKMENEKAKDNISLRKKEDYLNEKRDEVNELKSEQKRKESELTDILIKSRKKLDEYE